MQTLKEKLEKLHIDRDPYELLNTDPSAPFSELKKNYRILALKYHPDRNKDEEATQIFIQLTRAYQFLDKEENRKLYADHIKAMKEQGERMESMKKQRKNLIEDLMKREEEKKKRGEEMAAELKRRKQFFDKMQKEEEERQKLRQEINQEMNPKQFYEKLSSVDLQWEKGLSFTQSMLQNYFKDLGEIAKIKIYPKRRQSTITFTSIERSAQIVRQFDHPLISIQLTIKGNDRARLLSALQKRKTSLDLSLSTENIQRLKDMLNRQSNLYITPKLPQQ